MPAETAFGHDQTCVTRTFFGGFNHVSILTDSKESRKEAEYIWRKKEHSDQISVANDVLYEVVVKRLECSIKVLEL